MAKMGLDFETTNATGYKSGLGKRGEGICMCWTSNWAKKILRVGRKLKNKGEIGNELAIAAQHSGINVGLSTGTMKDTWHEEVFERQGLKGVEVGSASFSDDFMQEVVKSKGTYYLYITGDRGAHAMGLYRGAFYNAFFDPNFGQHSCTRRSTFMAFVLQHVKTVYRNACDKSWVVWKLT